MPPLRYHAGQVAVQDEANTRALADHLAHWVGPVEEFAEQADIVVFAAPGPAGWLEATMLSGPPPLARATGPGQLAFRFPEGGAPPPAGVVGGLVINLGLLRRARVNGVLRTDGPFPELDARETFTLCRKYMAPSIGAFARDDLAAAEPIAGPSARSEVAMDDPAVAALVARAETAFLLSVAPDGGPDVAHRGGPPGFLAFDAAAGAVAWPELLGDGVFKSAGNVRATGRLTLLVPDPDTGEGVELVCSGAVYENVLTSRKRRVDPLVEHRDPFPVQGRITAKVDRTLRLHGLMHPRTRIERALKVTSRSAVDEQAPQ